MTLLNTADMTLPQLVDHQAAARGDAEFLRNGNQTVTFSELSEKSRWFSRALAARGVSRGDRVALATENRPEWLIAFFGLLRLGAIAVTINPLYREAELSFMLRTTKAVAVISESMSGNYDLADFYSRADLPDLQFKVFLPGSPALDNAKSDSFADILSAGQKAEPVAETGAAEAMLNHGDPAVILFSSGTTGQPKGAVLTHQSIIASAQAQVETFDQTSDDVLIGVMPLNHVGGITCTITSSLVSGGRVEQIRRFSPGAVVDLMLESRATIFSGVPTMYIMMMADRRLRNADLSRVRLCVIGGSNVEPATATAVMDTFTSARLANLYGLSESSGACIISPKGESLEDLTATIGTAIGSFDARVVDGDGAVLPEGEPGSLQIKGECVMRGYWELPEMTAETLTSDGWLNTGDIAVRSADGHISLRGRSKEMFVRGGYNVFPAEVENTISQLEDVTMVAVVGVQDEVYGAAGRAYVVCGEGSQLSTDEVREHCRRALASYKVPDSVVFVDSLPLTPSGKIKKGELRD